MSAQIGKQADLCLDGFCIGQNIKDRHFEQVDWLVPKDVTKAACDGLSCKPEIAFRGYSSEDQKQLADAVSLKYGLFNYNLITKQNLAALRKYAYECSPSPRGGISGQRRFVGFYASTPSKYLTLVGLRLMNGELKVYRIARQYPYHNANELMSLGTTLHQEYGDQIFFYDGISSNAYSDVIRLGKNGWFAHSTMYNPTDPADNQAELVLIDPNTRPLLQPTAMPDSGEISGLPARLPSQCGASISIQ
ncbi:MAG TPA: hypothetical protein VJO35_05085 [Terriglobales bacterium]|nr:hypothetical protein [Terriglobales bacterium]